MNMMEENKTNNKDRIIMGIYITSMGISTTAMVIVGLLEICMLVYTVLNPSLYGEDRIWRYRAFYISLLVMAVVYIAMNVHIKKDFEQRFVILNIANPMYAVLFFAWSLAVSYSDALKNGRVDLTVFTTFSLIVLISFYLFPKVYAVIVVMADIFLLSMIVAVSGSLSSLINSTIYFVFQIVLGISFLRLKTKLAERIVREHENADMDILTGFSNRRAYEKEMKKEYIHSDFVYIAVDVNGLKEINDNYGHETGDKLIRGAAQCIEKCFGKKGKMFRIGGDEFAVMIHAGRDELEELFNSYEDSMKSWSESNGVTLSASYGYACNNDHTDSSMVDLSRIADEKMYMAKADYYRIRGNDRRKLP